MIDRALLEREGEARINKLGGAPVPSVRQPVSQLSGVQRQSVTIARALTFRAKLIIMDGPTAALRRAF
jgi:ABC-type sugar transport system ATPase subunit